MVGMVEYDSPEEFRPDNAGSFSLKSDPKATRFGSNSLLYCGSKLYSDAMIGLVLYSGQHTRIFRQNLYDDTMHRFTQTKKRVLISMRNPLINLNLGIAIVAIFCSSLLALTDKKLYQRLVMIEGLHSWSLYIVKILSTFGFMISFVPSYLFFVMEVAVAVISLSVELKLKTTFKSVFSCGRKKKNTIMETSMNLASSDDKTILEKPERSTPGGAMYNSDFSYHVEQKEDEIISELKLAGIEGNQKDNIELSPKGRRNSSFTGNQILPTISSFQSHSAEVVDEKVDLTLLSLDLMMTLSSADHIVFDKTDTLTEGNFWVGKISTSRRDYSFTLSDDKLDQMIKESVRNYAKYALSDSDDEIANFEREGYSEKSQE